MIYIKVIIAFSIHTLPAYPVQGHGEMENINNFGPCLYQVASLLHFIQRLSLSSLSFLLALSLNLHVFGLLEEKSKTRRKVTSHREHAAIWISFKSFFCCELSIQIERLYRLATHLSLALQRSWSTSLLRDHFCWSYLFPSQTALIVAADVDSVSTCPRLQRSPSAPNIISLNISCQAIFTQICSMCHRNVCAGRRTAACFISVAGKKWSCLPPVPQECLCVNCGVSAEHAGHECEEFLFPKSLAGACKHTQCTCNLP